MFRTPHDKDKKPRSGRLPGWVNSLIGNTFTPERVVNNGEEETRRLGEDDPGGTEGNGGTGGGAEPRAAEIDDAQTALEALSLVRLPVLSRCNNKEREWLRAAADRVDYFLHAVGAFHSGEEKEAGEWKGLLEDGRKTRAELWARWTEFDDDFKVRKRLEAKAQAGEVWDQIEDRLQKAVEYLQQYQGMFAAPGATGAIPKVRVHPPSNPQTAGSVRNETNEGSRAVARVAPEASAPDPSRRLGDRNTQGSSNPRMRDTERTQGSTNPRVTRQNAIRNDEALVVAGGEEDEDDEWMIRAQQGNLLPLLGATGGAGGAQVAGNDEVSIPPLRRAPANGRPQAGRGEAGGRGTEGTARGALGGTGAVAQEAGGAGAAATTGRGNRTAGREGMAAVEPAADGRPVQPGPEDRRRLREQELAERGLGPVLNLLHHGNRTPPGGAQARGRAAGAPPDLQHRMYEELNDRLTQQIREQHQRVQREIYEDIARRFDEGWEGLQRHTQQQFQQLAQLIREGQVPPPPTTGSPTRRRDQNPRESTPRDGRRRGEENGRMEGPSHSDILLAPAADRQPERQAAQTNVRAATAPAPARTGAAAQDPTRRNTGGRVQSFPLPALIQRYAQDIPNYGRCAPRTVWNVGAADEPAQWYKDNFPPPWDEPPNSESEFISQIKNLRSVCPKFSGELADYSPWMYSFIPNVHKANTAVGYKATCLKECISSAKDPKLKELVKGMGTSREDYAHAIEHLDRWYGHPEGLLATRLQELNKVKQVRYEQLEEAEIWFLRLHKYCQTAKSMGRSADLVSTALYEENLARMDRTMRRSYLDWQSKYAPCRDLLSIMAWLNDYLAALREASRHGQTPETTLQGVGLLARDEEDEEETRSRRNPRPGPGGGEARTPRLMCPLCDTGHGLALCDRFRRAEPEERRKWLNDWQRCYSCLQPGHRISECSAGVKCGKCTKNHHTLVHDIRLTRRRRRERVHFVGEEEEEEWSDDSSVVADSCFTSRASKGGVSLQTAPVALINPETNAVVHLNLLMDPGATGAFLSKKAAEEIGATGRSIRTQITGFGGLKKEMTVAVVKLQVRALQGKKKYWVEFQVTDNPAASYTPHDWNAKKKEFEHLRSLPIPPPVPGKNVDILLGMAAPHLLTSLRADVGGRHRKDPVARQTRLGWVVGGPLGQVEREQEAQLAFFTKSLLTPPPTDDHPWATWNLGKKREKSIQTVHMQAEPDARDQSKLTKIAEAELNAVVTRMWEIDQALRQRPESPLDDAILAQLRGKLRMVEGKYQLPTLWKSGQPKLPNNFSFAKKRLKSLVEGKHFKDEKIRKEYLANMDGWIEEDQVEEVHTSQPEKDRANYLPHFAVVNPHKISSSVRPVMDGKAKGATGVSLNDCLHKGPKLINELTLVFLRFRHKSITIGADVRKMFYQIRMDPEDRDWHRFLWPEGDGYKVFRWKVHPFGSAASPCISMFTIKEHARRLREKFPRAAETVIRSTLVDDNLDSVDTVEEGKRLAAELKELYAEAGMELRKVVSNSEEVWEQFSEVERSPSINMAEICTKDLTLPLVKTLGVIYISAEDSFSFHMKEPGEMQWTKRTVLSFEAQLYDPHGLVTPFIVLARILVQDMWRAGLEWDQPLTAPLLKRWKAWLEELPLLAQLRVPRCLHGLWDEAPGEEEAHIFCDASGSAYAAVAYWVTTKGSVRTSRLAVARTKVAPLSQQSIPRLELLATQLALDIAELLVQALPIDMEHIWMWTDSTNVLCWLRSPSKSLHTFVGHKIARMQSTSPKGHWQWVPTDQNPADIPSRGATIKELKGKSLWWKGLEFLQAGRRHWPSQPLQLQPTEDTLKEVKKGDTFALHTVQQTEEQVALVNRQVGHLRDGYSLERDTWPILFGSWQKTLRVTAWCLRWRNKRRGSHLTGQELRSAENYIWAKIQGCCLARTKEDLLAGEGLSTFSTVADMRPFLDGKGVIRTNARLRLLHHLPFETKHQIILPKDHPLVKLFLRHIHENVLRHGGAQQILSHLLRKYWVVRSRALVRSVVTTCITCKRRRATPEGQEMAPLPPVRVPEMRLAPFLHTALDMAGPFRVKYGTQGETHKSYFLLLTCMVFRAVHLEPLADMTTDSFLQAFDRFTARRGTPTVVLSDNGSNFIGGYNELRRLWNRQKKEDVIRKKPFITWDFTPPRGPHFGGVYERLIQSVKRALYHTFTPEEVVPWETFHTSLVVVEGILNTRPLAYIGADPRDVAPLTPADFLGTAPYLSFCELPEGGWNARKAWHYTQEKLDRLWQRWCLEVRPHLQAVTTWRRPRRSVGTGDVVAFLDEKRRGKWPIGRITEVTPSQDGHVRRVVVLVAGTEYRRPIHQVAVLIPADHLPLPPPAAH